MKIMLGFTIAIFAINSIAANLQWNEVVESVEYSLTQDIKLKLGDKVFNLPENSKFTVLEISPLKMLKVNLYKLKIKKCHLRNIATELDLISIKQKNSKSVSVGVDLTKDCLIEVYVENKDVKTESFLN